MQNKYKAKPSDKAENLVSVKKIIWFVAIRGRSYPQPRFCKKNGAKIKKIQSARQNISFYRAREV